jgi:hypothetical protein
MRSDRPALLPTATYPPRALPIGSRCETRDRTASIEALMLPYVARLNRPATAYPPGMVLRRPSGFIEPCLLSNAARLRRRHREQQVRARALLCGGPQVLLWVMTRNAQIGQNISA